MFILPANKLLVGLNKNSVMITVVKIDPEFRRNPAGIPARTNLELLPAFPRIPVEFHRNLSRIPNYSSWDFRTEFC